MTTATDVTRALSAPARVAAVRRILTELPSRQILDPLTALAAELLECLIGLLDTDRQRFVSSYGQPDEIVAMGCTSLDYSICQYAVASSRLLVVGDAEADPVLATNLAVTALGVRAYAGIPLKTTEGQALGTLLRARHCPPGMEQRSSGPARRSGQHHPRRVPAPSPRGPEGLRGAVGGGAVDVLLAASSVEDRDRRRRC